MMRFFVFFAALVFLALSAVPQARADYYVWQDAKTGLSLSFPDDWHIVSSQKPGDLLTIMAPSGRGQAMCHVNAHQDGRFSIYPQRYGDEIQKLNFSLEFWQRYLGAYENAEIYNVQNGAGIGRGYAGYAVAGYDSAVPGPYMHRKALMFASLYGNKLYVLECSAHEDAFGLWKSLFLSVAGSVDFKKADHQLVTGNYRPFLADPSMEFKGIEGSSYILY